MLAKKKKSKVDKAASAALAALEAMEASALPPGLGVPETPVKKKKLKKKDLLPQQEESQPADPPTLKPASAPVGPTMAEKVGSIKLELGLDDSLPLAKAVTQANEAMGLEATGKLADQVEVLLEQLGIDLTPSSAPPAPAPVAVEVASEPEPAMDTPTEAVAQKSASTGAASADAEEESTEGAMAEPTVQKEKPTDESSVKEVILSKKKQGKKKKQDDAGELEAEAPADPSLDQSGRRSMGTKRIEKITDAPADFAYIKINNGHLRFRNQEVLRGVTWDVQTGQRVGLVGDNGAGKTTQLKVLAEELELDEGELIKSNADIKVAFLRQEFREDLRESRTLKAELTSIFSEVQELNEAFAKCEEELANAGDDTEKMQASLDKMADIQSKLDTADAGSVDRRVDKVTACHAMFADSTSSHEMKRVNESAHIPSTVLCCNFFLAALADVSTSSQNDSVCFTCWQVLGAMGFTASDAELSVGAFSGGWKMRIGLAKILLQVELDVLTGLSDCTNPPHFQLEHQYRCSATPCQEPSVLLLDEPTNHMALERVEWLERYLIEQPASQMYHLSALISFWMYARSLSAAVLQTSNLALVIGVAFPHNGNYRSFLKAKQQRDELQMRAYDRQQKEIK
ncbi:MAG: hypothetical protein SGPRY_014429, partial [Prymnesium sp.]